MNSSAGPDGPCCCLAASRGHTAAGRKRKRGSDLTAMDGDLPQQAQQGAQGAAGLAAAEPVAQREPQQRQPTEGHRAAGSARPAGVGGPSMPVP